MSTEKTVYVCELRWVGTQSLQPLGIDPYTRENVRHSTTRKSTDCAVQKLRSLVNTQLFSSASGCLGVEGSSVFVFGE